MSDQGSYDILEDDDDSLIDFDVVSNYAKNGLKNPRMIAHAMGLPVEWFEEDYKEQVDLAIERGLAWLALETTQQIRENAQQGDFNAQKYILQNIDNTWSDRKETVERKEISIEDLPSLTELFHHGLADMREKEVKDADAIDGEYTEE